MGKQYSIRKSERVTCWQCGYSFVTRAGAKYCSNKCKQAHYRERKRIEKLQREWQEVLPFDWS